MKTKTRQYLDKKINEYRPKNMISRGDSAEYRDAAMFYDPFRRSYFKYFEDLFKIYHEAYFLKTFNIYEIKKTSPKYIFKVALEYGKITFDGKNYRLDNYLDMYKILINKDFTVHTIQVEDSQYNRDYDSNGRDKKNRQDISDIIANQYVAQTPFISRQNLEDFVTHQLRKVTKHLSLNDMDKKELKNLYFKYEIETVKSTPLKLKSLIKKYRYDNDVELIKNNNLWYINDNDEIYVKSSTIESNIKDAFKVYQEISMITFPEELIFTLGLEEYEIEHRGDTDKIIGNINKDYHFGVEFDGFYENARNSYYIIEDLALLHNRSQFGIYTDSNREKYSYLNKRIAIKGNPNNLNNPILGYWMGLPLRKINYDYEYWYRKAFKDKRRII